MRWKKAPTTLNSNTTKIIIIFSSQTAVKRVTLWSCTPQRHAGCLRNSQTRAIYLIPTSIFSFFQCDREIIENFILTNLFVFSEGLLLSTGPLLFLRQLLYNE